MKGRKTGGRDRTRRPIYLALALGALGLALAISLLGYARFAGAHGSAAPWQPDGLAGETVHFLAVGHSHPGLVFAGTETGVFRRGADGSWTHVLTQAGIWSVALLPDDRTVIAGSQGGVLDLSTDAGAHWAAARVTSGAVYAVAFAGTGRDVLLAGAEGGLFRSVDGGAHWQRRLTLPGSAVAAITPQAGNTRAIFAGAVAGTAQGATGVYVSHDAGSSWSPYGRRLGSGGGIMSLALGPDHRLLAGTMGRAIWAVTGITGLWARTATGMPVKNDHVAGIAVVPGRVPAIYVGTLGTGVYRTIDGGRHWTQLADGLPGAQGAVIVLSVAYSPATHTLYAGTDQSVYRLHAPVTATSG